MTTIIPSESKDQLQKWFNFLEYDPKNTHLITSIIESALATNQLDILHQMITHIQNHDFHPPQLCGLLSLVCLQLGKCEEAIIFGEYTLGTEYENVTTRHNLAYAQLYKGQYQKARELLQPLIESSNEVNSDTCVLYARIMHHLELPDDAISALEKAIVLNPSHAEALGNLALLQYETGHNLSDYSNVKETANKALTIAPYQLEALLALAEVQLNERSISNARNNFNLILEHHPQSGRAWSGLGQLEYYETNIDLAEKHLLTAVEYMKDHVGTWHVLGWCYILKNNIEKAAWAFETSLPLNTEFADSYGGLAVVEAMRHNTTVAKQWIKKAFELDEHSMAATFAEYVLLNNEGSPEAAQQKMNSILIRRAPSSDRSGQTLVNEWLVQHPNLQKYLNQEDDHE
ncbi:tetratricopeptide repeat protein [Acinetobacter sp. 3657]|uniref:tetratricopeptide repeat protein n=1 Tax=Acinetobacter sp. 3657 TaxID=2817764 RepID=UPI002861D54C|nr:tetratricopeptide (TPR) repeat protein [Prolinoborus sp. 3657]